MKTKIVTIILSLMFFAGCSDLTYEQRQVWSEAFKNIAESQERQLDRFYYNQQRPRMIYPQPNYWQEQRARQ